MTQSSDSQLDRFWSDAGNWSALGSYRCAADPRLVVPKQRPSMGWTVNLGRRGAMPLLVSIVALGVVPTGAALLFAPHEPWAFLAVAAGSATAVVLVTFGLNRIARGKSFLPRLGKVPEHTRLILEREGIELIDESVRCAVHFRNFRAPGRRYTWRRSGFTGSIVLTGVRFAVFTRFRSAVDVPLADAAFAQLECSLRDEQTLSIRYDPRLFDPEHSGSVEVRVKTRLARRFLDRLSAPSS